MAFDLHGCNPSIFSGGRRNPRTLEVNLACSWNHRDHPLHLLYLGTVSPGMTVTKLSYEKFKALVLR